MKKRIRAGVADTMEAIADAQRVRNQVFIAEKGLLRHPTTRTDGDTATMSDREMDIYDSAPTTRQFIVYVDDAPVATARLIRPNQDIARALGQPLGLDLASRYDLRPFVAAGVSFAEVSRMCIVPVHRGTEVLCELYLAMYRESQRDGFSHWVGAANTETDVLEDAEIAYRIAQHNGIVSPRWSILPWPWASATEPSKQPFYTPEERVRARADDLRDLRFPRTLATFTRLAARYIGPPIRERGYTVCSLPLVVDLADVVQTRAFQRAVGRS